LAPRAHRSRAPVDRVHELVDELELLERRPPRIPLLPLRSRSQPDGERLREVLVRMALCIPRFEMLYEALAVRPRLVRRRILLRRPAEELDPPSSPPQTIRVLDRVARLVAQDLHAPLGRATLDLQ